MLRNALYTTAFSFCTFLLSHQAPAQAQTETEQQQKNSALFWQFQWDNDVLVGSDGNFTNGAMLALGRHYASEQALIDNDNTMANFHRRFTFSQNINQAQYGISLSQRIFTPEDFEIPQAQPNERPYAGYLALQSFYGQHSETSSQKNWFAVGYIGKDSGGQYIHETVHDLIGSPEPMGWYYQIEEQVTFQLAYQIDQLVFRQPLSQTQEWELSTYSYSQLGNFVSESYLGLMLRSSQVLENSFGLLSPHYGHSSNWSVLADRQWLYYGYMQMGYRNNDLTIEGDLPYVTDIKTQHFQISGRAGFIYPINGFALGFNVNVYSKAYQQDNKQWHAYASLSIQGNL